MSRSPSRSAAAVLGVPFTGVAGCGGGEISDGSDGSSTRCMWRADGAGEVYAYLPASEEHATSLAGGALRIDGPFFSTFFGGGGSSWASPADEHADFAEFDLTEGSEPPPGEPPASDDDSDCGTPGAS